MNALEIGWSVSMILGAGGKTVSSFSDRSLQLPSAHTDRSLQLVRPLRGQDIPLGVALYPAMSVKGKAAFCFGPSDRGSPPQPDPPGCRVLKLGRVEVELFFGTQVGVLLGGPTV